LQRTLPSERAINVPDTLDAYGADLLQALSGGAFPNHAPERSTAMTSFARQTRPFRLLSLALLAILAVQSLALAGSGTTGGLPYGLPSLPVMSEAVALHEQAGIAINGFDPVAFFAEGAAVGGLARHEAQHDGVVWRFARRANREAFLQTPEAYMPRFGGHDPIGVANGQIVDARPDLFLIVDDRLLLFRTEQGRDAVRANPGLLGKADQKWPEVSLQLAR
jgi:hypothetical protein